MIPIAGSAYTYGYATLGELVAWIIGWDLILEYLFAAVHGRGGLVGLLRRPSRATSASTCRRRYTAPPCTRAGRHAAAPLCGPGQRGCAAGCGEGIDPPTLRHGTAVFNVPAVHRAADDALLVVGIQESARFNNIIVFVKMAVVLLFIGFGRMYVTPTTGRRSFRPTPASSATSAGAASSAARR